MMLLYWICLPIITHFMSIFALSICYLFAKVEQSFLLSTLYLFTLKIELQLRIAPVKLFVKTSLIWIWTVFQRFYDTSKLPRLPFIICCKFKRELLHNVKLLFFCIQKIIFSSFILRCLCWCQNYVFYQKI